MQSNLYDTIIASFCYEQFCFREVRTEHPNGLFKTFKHEFDLIVLNPKKIIFFAVVGSSKSDEEATFQLRGALNSIASKLSLSLSDFVVCGIDQEHYYFLNKYNDRLLVFAQGTDEERFLFECIENELSYAPEKFGIDVIRNVNDNLMLSLSPSKISNSKQKIMTTADGTTYVYKHGLWREVSALNAELLFPITAFGGIFGLHLFYQKRVAAGILYLLTLGLCGIGWILDSLALLLGIYRDKDGKYLAPLENTLSGIIIFSIAAIACFVTIMFFPELYNFLTGLFGV